MVEHHIQRDILKRLMHAKSLRFTDLKADGLESNIFMYHLKQLQRAGYLTKNDNGDYELLHAGLSYVDGLHSSGNLKPSRQPKVIAILALQNRAGQWLLVRRKAQPYVGELMFFSGQQHFDESFTDQAQREISEKFSAGCQLTYHGLADIQIMKNGDILTHVIAHVHHGIYDGPLPAEDAQFTYNWYDDPASQTLLAGTRELYERFQVDSEPFAISLVV